MAGYTGAGQNIDIKKYDKLFVDTMKQNMRLYPHCLHQSYVPNKKLAIEEPVIEISNYNTFFDILLTDEAITQSVKQLALEAATIVDFQIRKQVQTRRANINDATGIVCVDIFDGELEKRNLNFILVTNSGATLVDPASLIHGWAAYRFQFAAGFLRPDFQIKLD